MKLKKIASLMLAGVMAVSMLAGCSGKPAEENKPETPTVQPGTASAVIDALSDDTTSKVAFTDDASLQAVLEMVVKNAGNDLNSVTADALIKIDPTLGGVGKLPGTVGGINNVAETTDKASQTFVGVAHVATQELETYATKRLAALIDDAKVGYTNVGNSGEATCADLADQSRSYENNTADEYWYNFDYTGKMALVEMTDASTGVSNYIVAYTVTRTPTKTAKADV